MMGRVSLSLFLPWSIMTGVALAQDVDLINLRELYYGASKSASVTETFVNKVNAIPHDTPLLRGYRGMGSLLKASHAFNPYSKIQYFREGRAMLEEAIREDPQNPELRFFRYSVQTNAPFFLGYSEDIKNDEELLVGYAEGTFSSKGEEDLRIRVRDYLRERKVLRESTNEPKRNR